MPPLPAVGFVYGSQTGNAESICKNMFTEAIERKLVDPKKSECLTLNQLSEKGVASLPILVIIAATSGDGGPPDNARKFCRALKKGFGDNALSGVRYCVLCLGDQNYENFCGFGRDVDTRFRELGGTRVLERGEADDGIGLEVVVEPWREKLLSGLPGFCTPSTHNGVSYPDSDGVAAPMSLKSRRSTTRTYITTLKEGRLPQYLDFHKTILPEVVRSLRSFGVQSLTLCLVPGTDQVIMNVSLSADFDFLALFSEQEEKLEAQSPAHIAWNKQSTSFHKDWVFCTEFHSSEEEWNKAVGH